MTFLHHCPLAVLTTLLIGPFSAAQLLAPSEAQASGAMLPLIRVEGLSSAEKTRIKGAIRMAAYGAQAPGSLLQIADKSKQPEVRNAKKSESLGPDDCFWWPIPERIRLSKAMPAVDPCTDQGTKIVVDSDRRILFLCKDGRSVDNFDISMGNQGVAKRKEGDEKTPLGHYNIAAPRASNKGFYKFVHIQYPTPAQERQGFTGSDVGIHGPARYFRCAGFLNIIIDWTDGCLAVASDEAMETVAKFVNDNKVSKISIYPLEEMGVKP